MSVLQITSFRLRSFRYLIKLCSTKDSDCLNLFYLRSDICDRDTHMEHPKKHLNSVLKSPILNSLVNLYRGNNIIFPDSVEAKEGTPAAAAEDTEELTRLRKEVTDAKKAKVNAEEHALK